MRRSALCAAAILSVLTATHAAADCIPADAGLAMKPPAQSPVRAALRTVPSPIAVDAPFAVELRVCGVLDDRIDRVLVDATMPAHRHGMNYRPEIADLGGGQYRAKGLLFHMPGRWQFEATVFSGGKPTRLTLDVDIK